MLGIDAEYKVDFCLVVWIVENTLDELVDWRDTRATCDEVDLGIFVGCPWETLEGGSECERITGCEGV